MIGTACEVINEKENQQDTENEEVPISRIKGEVAIQNGSVATNHENTIRVADIESKEVRMNK
jgi:hypothetical protein